MTYSFGSCFKGGRDLCLDLSGSESGDTDRYGLREAVCVTSEIVNVGNPSMCTWNEIHVHIH